MAHNMHSKDLLAGAVIGGLLGAVTALLVAPKSGKKIREDLYDACCDFTDKTCDMANSVSKRGHSIASTVSCATSGLSDKARELVDDVKEWVHPCEDEGCDDVMKDWAIGGLAGVVTGVVVGLLLAPKAGSDLRQTIADTYHDVSDRTQEAASKLGRRGKIFVAKKRASSKAEEWLDLARDLLDRFTGEAKEVSENITERGKEILGSRSKDLMDWASLGLRVWQHLKKRG